MAAAPAYLKLLPEGAAPTIDLHDFLEQLARRMGMIKRGAEPDTARAAVYFVRWWREEGGLIAAASSPLQFTGATTPDHGLGPTQGWGFDFQWQLGPEDRPTSKEDKARIVQAKMEACIDQHLATVEREESEELNVSPTQIKKQQVLEEEKRRKERYLKR
ncbi:hypothetical protein DXG03_003695 [Asterophora parasitica]|uniref:Uncharacterized protein n=1 Tax=Asterophora parasitica TaxID=117018 RepID=A0A9P7GFV7_9AGAR|nr:hypothetical protein DXG03_003695 [Asterophora parasitica]